MDNNHIVQLLANRRKATDQEINNKFDTAKIINFTAGQPTFKEFRDLTINDEHHSSYFAIKTALSDDDYSVTNVTRNEIFPGFVIQQNPAKLEIELEEYYDASLTVELFNEKHLLFKVIPHAQRLLLSISDLRYLLPKGKGMERIHIVVKNTNFKQFGVLNYSIKFNFSHAYPSGSFNPLYDLREKIGEWIVNKPRPPVIKFRDFREMELFTMKTLDNYLDELQIHSQTERQKAVAKAHLKLSQFAFGANMHVEGNRFLTSSMFNYNRLGDSQRVSAIRKMINRNR